MSEEAENRKKQYIREYQKNNYTNISFKVRTKEDRDILSILSMVPNKSEFIKQLIRDYADESGRNFWWQHGQRINEKSSIWGATFIFVFICCV